MKCEVWIHAHSNQWPIYPQTPLQIQSIQTVLDHLILLHVWHFTRNPKVQLAVKGGKQRQQPQRTWEQRTSATFLHPLRTTTFYFFRQSLRSTISQSSKYRTRLYIHVRYRFLLQSEWLLLAVLQFQVIVCSLYNTLVNLTLHMWSTSMNMKAWSPRLARGPLLGPSSCL